MRNLTSIVALNSDGVIGVGNQLPWHIKSDLQFFKNTTQNNVIIMGRKTHDSIGRCLPKRVNVILSHNPLTKENAETCKLAQSIEEALFTCEYIHTNNKRKEIFVVGGAKTYLEFMPFVDRYLITEVDKKVEGADAFFSQEIIDEIKSWKCNLINKTEYALPGDEAPFAIWEFIHPNPDIVRARRDEIIRVQAERNHFWKNVAQVRYLENVTHKLDIEHDSEICFLASSDEFDGDSVIQRVAN